MVHTMNELMAWLYDLRCQTEDDMNFLVGGVQKLSLAATSVLWGGNEWFAVEFCTPTSAEILLERSLHQLSIGAKITGWFCCKTIR